MRYPVLPGTVFVCLIAAGAQSLTACSSDEFSGCEASRTCKPVDAGGAAGDGSGLDGRGRPGGSGMGGSSTDEGGSAGQSVGPSDGGAHGTGGAASGGASGSGAAGDPATGGQAGTTAAGGASNVCFFGECNFDDGAIFQ